MCILCHLSDGLQFIGYPMVMGFVKIFVNGVKYITADELEEWVNTEDYRNHVTPHRFFLLDARRTDEHVVSHIYNATNIHSTFSQGEDTLKELREKIENVCEKDTLIVTYCAVGLRSAWLAKYLTKRGYTNVKVLYHGFYNWSNTGKPIFGCPEQETQVNEDGTETPTNAAIAAAVPASVGLPAAAAAAAAAASAPALKEKKRSSPFGKRPKKPLDRSVSESNLSSPRPAPPASSKIAALSSQINENAQLINKNRHSVSSINSKTNSNNNNNNITSADNSNNIMPSGEAGRNPLSASEGGRNNLHTSENWNNTEMTVNNQAVHMCTRACRPSQAVLPQHFIASLALEQKLSTKHKFPLWLSSHRKDIIATPLKAEPVAVPIAPSSGVATAAAPLSDVAPAVLPKQEDLAPSSDIATAGSPAH